MEQLLIIGKLIFYISLGTAFALYLDYKIDEKIKKEQLTEDKD